MNCLMNQSPKKKYYIYGLVDPRDDIIKYIGKGSKNRMYVHWAQMLRDKQEGNNYTKFNNLKEILEQNLKIQYKILYQTDDEKEAYSKETEFIVKYNTLIKFGGWNLREKSTPPILKTSPMKGKTHSDETKRKMSISHQGIPHPITEETKCKISKANKGKKRSEEQKQRISLAHKGQIPWNKENKNDNS